MFHVEKRRRSSSDNTDMPPDRFHIMASIRQVLPIENTGFTERIYSASEIPRKGIKTMKADIAIINGNRYLLNFLFPPVRRKIPETIQMIKSRGNTNSNKFLMFSLHDLLYPWLVKGHMLYPFSFKGIGDMKKAVPASYDRWI